MRATNKNLIYTIEDSQGNIIKPRTTGTFLFFSKTARDKWFEEKNKKWIDCDNPVGKTYKLVEVD